jgi:membrane protein implicated in regulation of membrane protease activity
MIANVFQALGPWNWWILAMILIGLEILAPGTFFLWFGISAFIIGTISLAVGSETAFWFWQVEVISFVVLSLVSALVGRRFMARYGLDEADNPDLNDRAGQLIGRTGVVLDEISGGQGRVKIGDGTWRVTGPDLPVGTKVKVVDQMPGGLVVEAI